METIMMINCQWSLNSIEATTGTGHYFIVFNNDMPVTSLLLTIQYQPHFILPPL